MLRTLYEDRYVRIELDDDERIVRYVRLDPPYASIDDLRAVNARLTGILVTFPRGELSLLLDVRRAPPRNDEAFEAEITRALGQILPVFKKRAMMLTTAVGKLQMRRIVKDHPHTDIALFSDEGEALAYLSAP